MGRGSLRDLLQRSLDARDLRNAVERLGVDDLRALGSFAAQPHPLVHCVVAAALSVLLSLSVDHQDDAEARLIVMRPWEVLRLELLTDTTELWRRMRKRLRQLETGRRVLAPAQIGFVSRELLRWLVVCESGRGREANWNDHSAVLSLDGVARVSSIAAALAAWTCLCVFYACGGVDYQQSSPSKRPIQLPWNSPASDPPASPTAERIHRHRRRRPSPLQQQENRTESPSSQHAARAWSRRVAFKLGGRFVLFHARVGSDQAVKWSLLVLDANWSHRALTRQSLTAQWKPFHALELQSRDALQSIFHLPLAALDAVLLQLAIHAQLLCDPTTMPAVSTVSAPLLLLHVLVVTSNSEDEVVIAAVGRATISMGTTIAALRKDLTTNLIGMEVQATKLRFLYRGSLLDSSLEEFHTAMDLLPTATLVQCSESPPSPVVRLERDVAQLLRNSGAPRHLPNLADHQPSIQMLTIKQPVTTAAGPQATAAIVIEMLRNWPAFVQFQQLQDSAVLFRRPPTSPPKRKPVKPRRTAFDEFLAAYEAADTHEIRPTVSQLPRRRFNRKTEFLRPLYATAAITSSSTACLTTPFVSEVLAALQQPCRLALDDDNNIIHVKSTASEGPAECVDVEFERDASCPSETLDGMEGVYAWQIVPNNAGSPPRWLRAVLRFVVHPIIELSDVQLEYFRVKISQRSIETNLEERFWSKGVDWEPFLTASDVHQQLLAQTFDLLSRSHPRGFGIDGVKFSKLMRECGAQPKFLSVGDAAFLFASGLAPGSSFEMTLDGFTLSLERVAALIARRRRQSIDDPLRKFCFDRLVRAPSLLSIWRGIVDNWRRQHKRTLVTQVARQYCAATRLQAWWRQVVVRRTHLGTLLKAKAERLAATAIQSAWRMHRCRAEFVKVRTAAVRLQLMIRARAELRRLRRERADLVERMRVKLVRWMRRRLGVLRAWKQLNARWIARRDRIWRRRQQLAGSAVLEFETRRYLLALYHSDVDSFKLEVVDAERSWRRLEVVSRAVVGAYVEQERDRRSALALRSMDLRSRVENDDLVIEAPPAMTDALVAADRTRRPRPRPNAALMAIARRIRAIRSSKHVRFYLDSRLTSLGKVRVLEQLNLCRC